MSAAAFTPGPWWVDDRRPVGAVQVQAKHRGEGSSYCVATVNWWERPEANAHLLAAAPDLYEAAMTAIGLMQPLTAQGEDAIWRPANKAWETLVSATRKARGEA